MKKMILTAALCLTMTAAATAQTVSAWETKADRSKLFELQDETVEFGYARNERAAYIVSGPFLSDDGGLRLRPYRRQC